MPETPASIISLNFNEEGLAKTTKSAKELESVFGRVAGLGERLGRAVMGLAGVAGIGAIVHDFMRIETAATRTALAVNNIRGGSGMMTALLGSQQATGVDAVDLAGGVRASQLFAGGRFLRNPANAGSYGTFLGHMSQATGLDATTLGMLLGEGLSFQGQSFSQQGAQGLLSQAYTASARAGQAGMSGDFLQALTGVVGTTGFFGGGRNRRSMVAALGAAMRGDPAFANPAVAGGAVGSVEQVIQGSLSNPRLMAALQMSGANINDVLSGNFSAAQKLAHFARSQGELPSKLFFYSTFGQQGGRLMEDLANGKVNPQEFQRKMRDADPQRALQGLMARAGQQEATAASDLKKIEATLVKDVAGPLKAIEKLLEIFSGHSLPFDLALGAIGGLKLGRGLNRALDRRAARAAGEAAGETAAHAGEEQAVKRGAGRLLGKALRFGGRLDGALLFGQEMLFPDKWFSNLTGGDLSDGSWVPNEFQGVRRKLRGMTPSQAERFLGGRLKHYGSEHSGDEQTYQMVLILSQMLAELRKQTDHGKGGTTGASYIPGGGGAASGNIFASYALSGPGALIATSLFPGGVGPLGSSSPNGVQPASYPTPGGGSGWQDCVLTWYDPALGGTNSGSGKKDPHSPTASGTPYSATAMTCAAPSAYAFGTQIQFSYGGNTVTCVVNDRGGAITGNHFDLSRAAANALGMRKAGVVNGKFKVTGSASKGPLKHIPGYTPPAGAHAETASVHGGGSGAYGGMALGGGFPKGGGSDVTINVNLDNRRIEQQRHRTRAM